MSFEISANNHINSSTKRRSSFLATLLSTSADVKLLRRENGWIDDKMTKKDKFYKVIESNRKYLRELGVISIGIFGSVVREEDSEHSDYDILVEFRKGKKSFKAFTSLCDFLDNCLGENYELITKESLSPYIGPHILKEIENVKITP